MPLRLGRPLAAVRRHPVWGAAGLVLLAGLGFGVREGIAMYRVREPRAAAEAALAQCDFDQAREHVAGCLRLRPRDAGLHLLAAQAARRAGLLDEAKQHLDACKAIRGRTEPDERLERTMLTAQGGGLPEVEDFLLYRVKANDPASARILEALAFGNIQVYRLNEAEACLQRLLELEPENVLALHHLGIVYETLHREKDALPLYERALKVQPANYRLRLQLARLLLRQKKTEEAARQFERIPPDHRERAVLLGLARCRDEQGAPDQARQLLDELLAKHPQDVEALILRGKLDMGVDRKADAEVWFRKAHAAQPHNREAVYQLFQSLQGQGKKEEAETYRRRVDEIDANRRKLETLRKRALENPGDVAARYEAGVLAVQIGDEEEGLRWLRGVLDMDPGHKPTHAALADYYERQGDADRAAFHRSRASGAAP
jgi:tetratricopeptide (TPR) repeat protein